MTISATAILFNKLNTIHNQLRVICELEQTDKYRKLLHQLDILCKRVDTRTSREILNEFVNEHSTSIDRIYTISSFKNDEMYKLKDEK